MKSVFHWIVIILLIIGGLNWGLVGLFNYDVVAAIFGVASMAARVIYVLVGLAAIYKLFMLGKCCKKDQSAQSSQPA